jgi:hypothetical protein
VSDNPFLAFVAFQEEVLSFQRRQLDAAKQAIAAGEDMVKFQRAGQEAAEAGVKAWLAWIELWTPRK